MHYRKLVIVLLIAVLFCTGCGKKADEQKESGKTAETSAPKKDEAAGKASSSSKKSADVPALPREKVLATPAWVQSVIEGKQPEMQSYKIFEVSWGAEKDSPDYLKGHVPGAVHFDTSLIEGEPLWNLLPPDQMEKNLLAYGITKDTPVILYGGESAACRVAFALLWAGVEDVKILDGGMTAWNAAGYVTEETPNKPQPAAAFGAKIPVHPEYVMDIKNVQKAMAESKKFQLVSIRSKEEYDGKTSGYSYMSKAGEPKGAIWGHAGKDANSMGDYLHADNTLITLDEMKALWKDRGIDTANELCFYCGTGWRASVPWIILYDNGIHATVYDGGWYEWIHHDDLPVQVGDPKEGSVEYKTVKDLPDGMEKK